MPESIANKVLAETRHAVRNAFQRARAASAPWAAAPVRDRLSVLRRFRHLLAENGAELASAVARPAAETLTAQLIPLADAIRFLEDAATSALAPRASGLGRRPLWLLGVSMVLHREPLGVVLVIAPSNYPLFIPGTQLVQSLAAGNAVVIKPGAGGHAAALALVRLLSRAGLPDGVVQILPESPESGRFAVEERPDHVLFTGSSETGRRILEAASRHAIPCTVELSGSDAMIVREDADLDRVTAALAFGLGLNAGATCIAPRRILIPASRAAELERRLASALNALPDIPFAPAQAARLRQVVEEAMAQGARLVGGRCHRPSSGAGLTHGPLVLADVPEGASILESDLFGPVVSLVTAADDDDAVRLANAGPFALGASVFTHDLAEGARIARRLAAGVVTLNDVIAPTADPRVPFGGRAGSGYGVTRGLEGLLALTRTKAISIRHGRWAPHLDPSATQDARFFEAVLRLTHAGSVTGRFRAFLEFVRRAGTRGVGTRSAIPSASTQPAPQL